MADRKGEEKKVNVLSHESLEGRGRGPGSLSGTSPRGSGVMPFASQCVFMLRSHKAVQSHAALIVPKWEKGKKKLMPPGYIQSD